MIILTLCILPWYFIIFYTRSYTIGCCFRAALVSCLQNQVTSCKKEKVYCKQCFWQSMNSSWIIIEASNFKSNHQWGCWYYIQHTMVHKRDNSRQHATIKVIYPKYYKHWLYTLAYKIQPHLYKSGAKVTHCISLKRAACYRIPLQRLYWLYML